MFVDSSFGVYIDSESARWHFDQFAQLKFKYELYNRDVDDFVSTDRYAVRISAFHVSFPAETTWLTRLEKTYAVVDHVFVFCSELHDATVAQLRALDRPNISIYSCGVFAEPFAHAHAGTWMDWFHTSSEFYVRTHPGFLNTRLAPMLPKPKSFDILLGNQRPHRDFVFDYINSHNLNSDVVMTYVYHAHLPIRGNDQFIMETNGIEFDPDRKYTHSIDSVKYHGTWITLSQVIPLDIYNQTAYSLVAETNFSNEYNFYTEKIVKPILARRLFVVIAGRHYLKNLRAMGFQTFDGIIDESYDNIENNQDRWSAALTQVHWLMAQDQSVVLDKIQRIVDHNHAHIESHNWYTEFSHQLEQQVSQLYQNCPNVHHLG
jgi:hypothetical protein